jgi:hypothetical protein
VTDIASISIREDSLIWSELTKNEKEITIHRAAFQTLPIFIHHQSIQKKSSITQIATLLKQIAQKRQFQNNKINLTFPGQFAIIKKIVLDKSISAEMQKDFILYEFEKSWDESSQNYSIFLPENQETANSTREILAIAVRKTTLEFFEKIFNKAQLELETITPSCFAIEELFRLLFPNSSGQSLLLGWHRRGLEAIITDHKNFRDYYFRPYNSTLDLIENVTEFDLANGFSNLFFEIQQPRVLDQPRYDIQTIYNFGYYFRPEWLDFMRSRIQIPSNLFNSDTSTSFQINLNDPQLSHEEIYKYIEAISSISLFN